MAGVTDFGMRRLAQPFGAALTVSEMLDAEFYISGDREAAIRKVREAIAIPLVANGDCTSAADAAAMLEASGADAVMIGRAAIGRPWLIGQIADHPASRQAPQDPSPALRAEAAREHYRTLLSLSGKTKGLRHARKHLAAYVQGANRPDAAALRVRLVTSEDPAEVEALLTMLLDAEPVAGTA